MFYNSPVKKPLYPVLILLLAGVFALAQSLYAIPPAQDEPWIPPEEGGGLHAPPPDPGFEETWKASTSRKSPEELMIEQIGGIQKVVIDPGHGGYDPGLPGEKERVLDVARELENIFLRAGSEVVLTRTSNRYVPVSERAEIVWKENPDLFFSLHMSRRFFSVYHVGSGSAREESLSMKERMTKTLSGAFGPDKVLNRRLPLHLLSSINVPGVLLEIPVDIDLEDKEAMGMLIRAMVFSISKKNENQLSPAYTQ